MNTRFFNSVAKQKIRNKMLISAGQVENEVFQNILLSEKKWARRKHFTQPKILEFLYLTSMNL